jgi:hypothetical protein
VNLPDSGKPEPSKALLPKESPQKVLPPRAWVPRQAYEEPGLVVRKQCEVRK